MNKIIEVIVLTIMFTLVLTGYEYYTVRKEEVKKEEAVFMANVEEAKLRKYIAETHSCVIIERFNKEVAMIIPGTDMSLPYHTAAYACMSENGVQFLLLTK